MRSTIRFAAVALAAVVLLLPTAVDATHLPEDNYVVEQLLEGHTVFTVLAVSDYLPASPAGPRATGARAVAPAVSSGQDAPDGGHPPSPSARVHRDPGVLWFNDQFLVSPTLTVEQLGGDGSPVVRNHFAAAIAVLVKRTDAEGRVYTPCGGAVLLTNAGDPDPRVSDPLAAPTALGGSASPLQYGYLESYALTDPNDHTWIIDRYAYYSRFSRDALTVEASHRFDVFVANVGGGPVFTPDVGVACEPKLDAPAALQPSLNGYCYNGLPVATPACAAYDGEPSVLHGPARAYNALLHAPLDALRVDRVPRDHGDRSMPDTNGCEARTSPWPCPAADDDAEGFSHPFRPSRPVTGLAGPCPAEVAAVTPADHGGSTAPFPACDAVHASRLVEVWFDPGARPPEPPVRDFAIIELGGSSAPFSSHG